MWAYESVFYQIYPIGFCGAPRVNDGVTVPRIRKVADWAEHIASLGCDAVYFSPIFESDSHGYDTRDFRRVDCRLGTNSRTSPPCAKPCMSMASRSFSTACSTMSAAASGRSATCSEKKLGIRPTKDWFHISFDGNVELQRRLLVRGLGGSLRAGKAQPAAILRSSSHINSSVSASGGRNSALTVCGWTLPTVSTRISSMRCAVSAIRSRRTSSSSASCSTATTTSSSATGCCIPARTTSATRACIPR